MYKVIVFHLAAVLGSVLFKHIGVVGLLEQKYNKVPLRKKKVGMHIKCNYNMNIIICESLKNHRI